MHSTSGLGWGRGLFRATLIGTALQLAMVVLGHIEPKIAALFAVLGMFLSLVAGFLFGRWSGGLAKGWGGGRRPGGWGGLRADRHPRVVLPGRRARLGDCVRHGKLGSHGRDWRFPGAADTPVGVWIREPGG
jgi:hypothetical protein